MTNPFMHLMRAASLAALSTLALAGCGSSDVTPAPNRPVETFVVPADSGGTKTVYSGSVVSRYDGQYSFRTSGIVSERLVEFGQEVTAGQALARLNTTDASLSLQSADAQVAAAAAAQVQQNADLERSRALLGRGFVSKNEIERRQTSADQASAQLRLTTAQRELARRQLSYTVLRAAKSGVVTAVNADIGSVVAAGQPVITVSNPGQIEVAISIPEADLAAFRRARLSVRLWNAPGIAYPGTIRLLAQAANNVTRTFDARIIFPAPSINGLIGTTAEVQAVFPVQSGVVRVPLSSITQRKGRPNVWVVSGKPLKAAPRVVTMTAMGQDAAVITSGLRPGERIVSAGAHLIQPGQSVTLARKNSAAR